ncbi:Zn(II)2Cys6 transcription factor [Aspergillus thermomutatus]|uniref:Zn(2)-C6 fungal-type domain-containing protein n=1 Tax=Aspergillus thermomutatus TaxID=41047 RepID=A0A397G8I1_ASPTH|nr:uncharacterized protein CDV56_102140 [Aspergillus thermomutatus]RHZ46897.1 hypothetical protein CDV56_102140 [Aspergillus thermomutatus]
MAGDTTLLELQPTGFRLRKTHEKSRNGCLRCKQQRKKCDELRPSCSRCTKRMYTCRYQNPSSDGNLSKEQGSTQIPVSSLPVSPTIPSTAVPNSASPLALSSGHSPLSSGQPASFSSLSTDEGRPPLDRHTPGTLDSIELSLLSHYLTHTSRTIPVDDLDLYALSVGVPNLAFSSGVVMSSLLALGAACKSHDIAKRAHALLDPQSLMDIRKLLALAERHHQASLRHIQATMQNSDSYDHVLANAALMVLYASASHSIRVHLAAAAKKCRQRLPNELLPQHSQWISFTRAAHTASTAILNGLVAAAEGICTAASSPILDARSKLPNPVLCSTDGLSPEDGPSENTKRIFLPLVASTFNRALESLCRRAELTTALLKSVTSMESPQILRRIIMSFLNKAPAEYLNLVRSVLDSPSAGARAENWTTRDSPGTEVPLLDATHLLAMDIFAHWLVLVMLLDGVWWISDIGEWELGQVVSLMKTQDLPSQPADIGQTWWPETMYSVKRELTPSAQH